ncbi:MAG: hypothetical protein M1358_01835 [Chloroflexi bacterium]|nr:hypothetical protein [Chloroflexota bacterium]
MWKNNVWKLDLWKLDLRLPKLWRATPHRNEEGYLRGLVLASKRAGQTRSEVIEKVAGEICNRAMVDEGWLLDLGVWGPSIYCPEARALVDEILGEEAAEAEAGAHSGEA